MTTVAATISAAGVTGVLTVKPGQSILYAATESTFVGVTYLERSRNGGSSWETIETATDASLTGGTLKNETKSDEWYRFRATLNGATPISGSIDVSVADVADTIVEYRDPDGVLLVKITDSGVETLKRPSRLLSVNAAGQAKAGTTAGFVVAVGDNIALVTCPASQTASTLVIPIPALSVGDTITGFYLVGQIESAGATATVDAALRKHTAAAADVSDASVGAIAQLSVTADTIMSSANTRKASLSEVVAIDETFYALITVTTAAATDIALQGIVLEITEA